jgi:DNA repair protein RadA/Sms
MRKVTNVAKAKTLLACSECRQQVAQWVGRCPGCGSWGSIEERAGGASGSGAAHLGLAPVPLVGPGAVPEADQPVSTGFEGFDRVLGAGLVPSSVVLLAGEPGIGKSTLLLHLMANLSIAGLPCLLVSGEESHAQVSARARRLGIAPGAVTFAPGRELEAVLQTARTARPFLLAVDSIQALRDSSGTQMPGGVSQVRTCTDALVGLAKTEGIAVVLTGHVTKDGDLAGPRTLEHAVDTVLTFDGDPRSGLRVLAGGKNRYGAEGETAWFEMGAQGLRQIDPTELLVSSERVSGAAVALPLAGRRALAVEVQALVAATEGPPRRQATGLDPRRFQLVAAVLDRAGIPLGRSDLFGASSGGVKIDDPACDLAVAAALASAASGLSAPAGSAFVGEVTLTGLVRASPGMAQRVSAARAAGCSIVYAPADDASGPVDRIRIVTVRRVYDALGWAFPPAGTRKRIA